MRTYWGMKTKAACSVAAVALVLTLAVPAQLQAQNLDERAETALARGPATGMVIAVVHADSLLLLQAFGDRDHEGNRPMEPGGLLHLGSLGEVLLGATAVSAALEGRVRLDAPVSTYVSDELPPGVGEATLAELLTHTAGLDDSPLVGRRPGEPAEALPPERELELLSDHALTSPPGMVRSISRFSFLVAEHVLEVALGQSLADAFQELVGEPARMTETVFSTEAEGARGRVQGYAPSQSPERPFAPASPGDDRLLPGHLRIWSTAAELARLLESWLGSLPLDVASAGPGAALHFASLPLVSDPADPDRTARFGFGWIVGEFEGWRELRASGSGPGHTGLLRVIPEARLGVVILANGSGRSFLELSSFVLGRLLPEVAPDAEELPLAGPGETELFPVPVVPPPAPVDEPGPEHAGTYRNGSEVLDLVEVEGGLAVEVGTGTPLELRERGEGLLTAHIADGRVAMRLRMVRDREGRVYLILRERAFLLAASESGG